jgi:hypothetical protein
MTGELVVADGTLLDEQYVADLEKNSGYHQPFSQI